MTNAPLARLRPTVCAILALAAAACASKPNPLTLDVREGLFVDDATVTWSVDDSERLDNEEYVAGKTDLLVRLEAAVEREFASSPSGSEAVALQVDVTRYSRVGAAMGNIIGGSNMVVADVTVVRASDGATLGTYEGVMGAYTSNGGVIGAIAQAAARPDIVGVMANSFATNLHGQFNKK